MCILLPSNTIFQTHLTKPIWIHHYTLLSHSESNNCAPIPQGSNIHHPLDCIHVTLSYAHTQSHIYKRARSHFRQSAQMRRYCARLFRTLASGRESPKGVRQINFPPTTYNINNTRVRCITIVCAKCVGCLAHNPVCHISALCVRKPFRGVLEIIMTSATIAFLF